MLDIKFICENPELVKNNIKRKFKDHKLPLVDEVIALYNEKKDANNRANELRANRNKISKQIGMLMAQGKRDEAEEAKKIVAQQAQELAECEAKEAELSEKRISIMLSQIQPHFLYNMLNTIYHLCDKDVELAKKAVDDFSTYLRNNINSLSTTELISFNKELLV